MGSSQHGGVVSKTLCSSAFNGIISSYQFMWWAFFIVVGGTGLATPRLLIPAAVKSIFQCQQSLDR